MAIDLDGEGFAIRAWFQTGNRNIAEQMLKLHNKVWVMRRIQTFVIGCQYEDDYEAETGDDSQIKIEKASMKAQYKKRSKKAKKAAAATTVTA